VSLLSRTGTGNGRTRRGDKGQAGATFSDGKADGDEVTYQRTEQAALIGILSDW